MSGAAREYERDRTPDRTRRSLRKGGRRERVCKLQPAGDMNPSNTPATRPDLDRPDMPGITPPQRPEVPVTPSTEPGPEKSPEIEVPTEPRPEINIPGPNEDPKEVPEIPDPHF